MSKKLRIPIPIELSAQVLYLSDRTCCVCNEKGKAVQIHHIDEDPANNSLHNLSVLCLACHNETMISGGFGRKLDANQVKLFRDNWLDTVSKKRVGIFRINYSSNPDIPAQGDSNFSQIFDYTPTPISVWEENGDIYTKYSDGSKKRLPHTGNDSNPLLHIQTNNVAFFRSTENGNEIYIHNLLSNKCESAICPSESKSIEERISDIGDLHFSPEGEFLYFTSRAWVVSGAIHRYDLRDKSRKYISPGNSLEIVPRGKYKGFLIVSKHKYKFPDTGSFDHYWLLTKDGEEIEDLGPDLDGVQNYLSYTMVN